MKVCILTQMDVNHTLKSEAPWKGCDNMLAAGGNGLPPPRAGPTRAQTKLLPHRAP